MRRWMLPVLGLLSVGIALEYWILYSGGSEAPPVQREVESEEVSGPNDVAETRLRPITRVQVRQLRAALGGERRSPFQTLDDTRAEARLHYQLTGTLVSRGHRVAWIDGRPRLVGDWLGSSRIFVSSIEDGRVRLGGGKGPIDLVVGPDAPRGVENPSKEVESSASLVEEEPR